MMVKKAALFKIVKRSLSSSKAWIKRHVNDSYVQKAVAGDMRSRSAFKLSELQENHKLIRSSDNVIDLGSSPGGWSLAVSKFLGSKLNGSGGGGGGGGVLVSVDLLPMLPVPGNSHFIQGDFRSAATREQIRKFSSSYDVVLSDMLQNTSGHHATDHFRSIDLCMTVLDFAAASDDVLRPGGSLLCKFLRGSDDNELLVEAKEIFDSVKLVKPKASRSESTEIYLLARGKKLS